MKLSPNLRKIPVPDTSEDAGPPKPEEENDPTGAPTTTVDDAFVVRALETDGTRARGAPPSSSSSFFLYLPVVARRRASSRWCFGI